jgi:hypothetical protein
MSRTPREFIDELGGYREVAARFGVSDKTIHSHASSKKLPPRWYIAFCELAGEKKVVPPPSDLFDFKPLVHANENGVVA